MSEHENKTVRILKDVLVVQEAIDRMVICQKNQAIQINDASYSDDILEILESDPNLRFTRLKRLLEKKQPKLYRIYNSGKRILII